MSVEDIACNTSVVFLRHSVYDHAWTHGRMNVRTVLTQNAFTVLTVVKAPKKLQVLHITTNQSVAQSLLTPAVRVRIARNAERCTS